MDNMEREIDLRQLIIYILMQWRLLFVACIVCALLGGGFKMIHDKRKAAQSRVKDAQTELYEYKLALYESIKAYYDAEIKEHTRQIEMEKEYQQKSLKMKIKASDVTVLTATLTFDVNPNSTVRQLLDAVKNDAFWEKPAAELGTMPPYIRELVSAEAGDAGQVSVTITTPDAKTAETILSHIVNGAAEKPKSIQKNISTRVDEAYAELQRNRVSNMTALSNQLRGIYLNYDNLKEPNKPAAMAKKGGLGGDAPVSAKRSFVKGAAIGAVGGGFAAVMLMALGLIMPGRVLSSGEFFGKYSFKCLTVLPPRPRCAKMRALDRLLLRWADNARYAKQGARERLAVAADSIRSQVREGDSILILGALELTRLEEVRVGLAPYLSGVRLESRRFVDQQLHTLRDIDRHENIILVEGILESKYQDVDHEVQALTERGKKVLGCIVV